MAGRKKGSILPAMIGCQLSGADKAQIENLSPEQLDAWVDARLAAKQARQADKVANSPRPLPKWLRPQCGAKTRAGGHCKATPVWDKTNNRPKNGRCRMHGGLSTGAKTEAGKRKVLECLAIGWERKRKK